MNRLDKDGELLTSASKERIKEKTGAERGKCGENKRETRLKGNRVNKKDRNDWKET